jgi:predicted dehydrogenase/nucleoside-diphosphate-sugar epimerase
MTIDASEPANLAAAVKTRTAARRPLTVAIVGAGFIAEYHLEVLRRMKGVSVVGACDPDSGRLAALKQNWQLPHAHRTLSDLIAECKPDAVHILAPPPYHYEAAEEALRLGVHVLIEKPMALSSTECSRLIDLARGNGLHLGVNHNAMHHPLYRRLERDLAAKKLGRIEHVVSINNLPLAQLQAGQHDHWMFRDARNVLFEQGPHPLSQICGLLGPVRHVQTLCTGAKTLRTGNRLFSSWQMGIACEQGTADLFMSFGRTFPEAILHVIGQDGTARLDLINNVYELDRATRWAAPLDNLIRRLGRSAQVAASGIRNFCNYGLSTLRLAGRTDPYYLSMQGGIEAFYKPLLKGQPDDDSAEGGRMVIEGLEMASEAANLPAPRVTSQPRVTPFRPRTGDTLVLGGTGFIGRRLVEALAHTGHPVRMLVRKSTLLPGAARSGDINVLVGDICNQDDVDRAVEGCRAVIHLVAGAPSDWAGFERLFVEGTRVVAEACLKHRVEQLLFASSICALYLGNGRVTISEVTPVDSHAKSRCDYAHAKILCEQLLLDLHRRQQLPVSIFRPGIVVGEGGQVEHLGVGAWPSPTHCVSWGARSYPLPFVLVDDVVSAFISALGKSDIAGRCFNLVGDVRMSANDYINALRAETGRDIRLHRRSVAAWKLIESLIWGIKAAARKSGNVAMSYRELAYRTSAAQFDTSGTKKTLDWHPVADRERFIELAIRAALAETQP